MQEASDGPEQTRPGKLDKNRHVTKELYRNPVFVQHKVGIKEAFEGGADCHILDEVTHQRGRI